MTQQAVSTELTGGAGFTYEDTVVAYHLAALLREERAAPLRGIVKTVAVQQAGHGDPMDDIIVEFDDDDSYRKLSLQAKRKITISAAYSNVDFRDILNRAVATRAAPGFQDGIDAYGFVGENIALDSLRTLQRLIDWAKSSPTGAHFATRFATGGAAAESERKMREELAPLIGAKSEDDEQKFYAHFTALKLDELTEGGVRRTEVVNRLQELIAANEDGQAVLLFDRLCRIARDGAGTARKWNRYTLLAQLRGTVRLNIAANYKHDLNLLQAFSAAGLAEISEDIAGFRVERPQVEQKIWERLTQTRLVNLSGLPGCGKSAMLKRIATVAAAKGPILLLKSDRLEGNGWLTFATTLGLKHHAIADLLAEIGGTGTPILFIDGIDRIPPNRRGVVTDILRAIEENEQLGNWQVLASSRDQGLEAYRSWFPASFYRQSRIGDVSVSGFSDEEAKALAEKIPSLYRLLFGAPAVREITRRPFFAAVLAQSFADNTATPHTEVDLIAAWWDRAGHNAPENEVPQRQRALLDFAEQGVRNLGKNIQARPLKDATIAQIAALKMDLIIRTQDSGASYSFTHDIFFEWVFFRHLIELGNKWMTGLVEAGEPPFLGRVVGLLAQSALTTPGKWSVGYRELEGQKTLRPQWRREWLTAAPFTPGFEQGKQEFQALLIENDYALFEKLLVWFQAQHTIPSPVVLQNPATAVDGVDRVGIAELLSWPSDFHSWGRLLDWLIPLAPSLPAKLLPYLVEVFGVWQNVFADLEDSRSAALIEGCSNWLIELEKVEYSQELKFERGRWDALGDEARSSLATALRMTIMRSARSYPMPAIALFDRAVANERMRREAYSDLMGFTSVMADVSAESVVAVAKAELMEELPKDKAEREEREYREHLESLERLRAIPEKDRTAKQKRTPNSGHFLIGRGSHHRDLDDFGIDRHHSYYFPPSALHEPFATLFVKKPEAALSLVRDLANHATKGWHQVQLLNRQRMGTPIPVTLEFPWGKQEFWGNWNVYNWFLGHLAPQPLECAFLALNYWAFKQIESGRPADEVIQAIVEGNECYAVLGLALVIALETYDASKTTLPLVTCQRLWEHDIARCVQEPTRNIDLLGLGFLSRLTGAKAKAQEFLDSRESRKRNILELPLRFVLSSEDALRERFKEALALFPKDLPYELEEQRSNASANVAFKENADRWAGLGDGKNYRKQKMGPNEIAISYKPPIPLTPEQEKRHADNTTSLREVTVIGWASQSLQANKIAANIKLEDAIAFAKARDNASIFVQRFDVGEHSPQTTVSATAAVVIRLGPTAGLDYDWAWDVMDRIFVMKEPDDVFAGSIIPWHPANHLVVALFHDRRASIPRKDTAQRLVKLTAHPNEGVAQNAFSALFRDSDEHIRWVAAKLAMDLSIYHDVEISDDGTRDNTGEQNARKQSLACALRCLKKKTPTPFTDVPPPWVKATDKRSALRFGAWHDANPSFIPQYAAKLFPRFPVEVWCQSPVYKPMFERTLMQLVSWTAERLMPSWRDEKSRHERDHSTTELIEWNHVLGDLLARAAPFFDTEVVRRDFLAPFLTDDEKGLAVLAAFAEMTVTRQVFDAPTVPINTVALLSDCVERAVRDPVFNPNRYRAGQLNGFDLPKLIEALLFVKLDKEAPGAARFANGDWSQIAIIIPLVTRLVATTGWSVFVMQKFLTLCERADVSYPIDAFSQQANAVLASIANAKGSWAGTLLPARIAASVQRLADANFPLHLDQAQELLKVLDALIDLGDRRSAALEQTEAFKEVQRTP